MLPPPNTVCLPVTTWHLIPIIPFLPKPLPSYPHILTFVKNFWTPYHPRHQGYVRPAVEIRWLPSLFMSLCAFFTAWLRVFLCLGHMFLVRGWHPCPTLLHLNEWMAFTYFVVFFPPPLVASQSVDGSKDGQIIPGRFLFIYLTGHKLLEKKKFN